MTWVAVVILGVVVIGALVFANRISDPMRPATDARYVSESFVAAAAVAVAAVLALLTAVLAANA